MILKILRATGAVAAGIAVVMILAIAAEMFSAIVHPFPDDFGGTHEEVCLHVEQYPAWVLAAIVPLWGFAAFAGTWTAGRFGNRASAIFLGVLLLAGIILNISMLPYPIWFEIAGVLIIAIAAACAYRITAPKPAAG